MLSRLLRVPPSFKQIFRPFIMSRPSSASPGAESSRVLKRQKLDHTDHDAKEPVPVMPQSAEAKTGEEEMSEAEMVEREMGLPVEYVRTYKHELDYRNKLVLAPMVRTGSCELPHPRRGCNGEKLTDL